MITRIDPFTIVLIISFLVLLIGGAAFECTDYVDYEPGWREANCSEKLEEEK